MDDDLFDRYIDYQIEFQMEVEYWLQQSDKTLREKTKMSRKPIIMSIRKFRPLSEKQRFVLASYIVQKEI